MGLGTKVTAVPHNPLHKLCECRVSVSATFDVSVIVLYGLQMEIQSTSCRRRIRFFSSCRHADSVVAKWLALLPRSKEVPSTNPSLGAFCVDFVQVL